MSVSCTGCGKINRANSKFCSGCGNALQGHSSLTAPLTAGTILENRYRIVNLIKAGGMGAVYKAVDIKFDSICAVKELRHPFGDSEIKPQAMKWFEREAKLLNKLDHANLPRVFDYFVCHNRYYLVMNYIDGEDMETILKREGNPGLPEDKVVEWGKQILNVLDYLHNQKPPVIYRDIKPANIMLHKDGRVMLIDFGLARVVQNSGSLKKTAVGTPGYVPPEQITGNVEIKSDLYAWGATVHHLLTGLYPVGPLMFKPLKKVIPHISDILESTVKKCLEVKVEDRFETAKEILEVLSVKPEKAEKKRVRLNNQSQQKIT